MSNPNRKPWRTFQEELDELERTDPDVKRAADNYDRTVKEILARRAPSPDGEEHSK